MYDPDEPTTGVDAMIALQPNEKQVGAVGAKPGSKLYDLLQQQAPKAAPKRNRQADIIQRLMQKSARGFGTPGEGMVPFGEMPSNIRGSVTGNEQPIIGWDPNVLAPDERLVLEHLRRQAQAEQAQNQQLMDDPMIIEGRRG